MYTAWPQRHKHFNNTKRHPSAESEASSSGLELHCDSYTSSFVLVGVFLQAFESSRGQKLTRVRVRVRKSSIAGLTSDKSRHYNFPFMVQCEVEELHHFSPNIQKRSQKNQKKTTIWKGGNTAAAVVAAAVVVGVRVSPQCV